MIRIIVYWGTLFRDTAIIMGEHVGTLLMFSSEWVDGSQCRSRGSTTVVSTFHLAMSSYTGSRSKGLR